MHHKCEHECSLHLLGSSPSVQGWWEHSDGNERATANLGMAKAGKHNHLHYGVKTGRQRAA